MILRPIAWIVGPFFLTLRYLWFLSVFVSFLYRWNLYPVGLEEEDVLYCSRRLNCLLVALVFGRVWIRCHAVPV